MMLFGIMLPSFTLNIERWRWNEEFQLWVSNQGHFKDKNGKVVPIKIESKGYCRVNFWLAHRVVVITWIPCDNPKDMTVDHLNHNKRDNSVKNLEWVTKEENARRAIEDLCNDPDISKAEMAACLKNRKKLPYNVCYTAAKSGKVETFSSYEDAAVFVFCNFGHSEKAETIITKIKKKMVNGSKVYGGYWTKETCA